MTFHHTRSYELFSMMWLWLGVGNRTGPVRPSTEPTTRERSTVLVCVVQVPNVPVNAVSGGPGSGHWTGATFVGWPGVGTLNASGTMPVPSALLIGEDDHLAFAIGVGLVGGDLDVGSADGRAGANHQEHRKTECRDQRDRRAQTVNTVKHALKFPSLCA